MNLALSLIAHSRRPILVGPWTSEMGFEVLYWVPFLEHLRHTHRIEPDRLHIITRGGAGVWYGAGHAIELYDYVPPHDLRLTALRAAQTTASIKQTGVTRWERKLLDLLSERHGLRRPHLIHPSMMYRALDRYWGDQTMGFAPMMRQLRVTTLQAPPLPVGTTLPERFVAVRWYQRPTWPLRDDLLDWTRSVVLEIAKTTPVVMLRSSAYLDDHVDFPAMTGQNITTITAEPWRENLAVQTAILQRAAGFVGTWGGMAQLAVRLGIPVAAFFDRWHSCAYAHRTLTEWIAMQQGSSCFVGRPQDIEFARSVLPACLALPELPKGSSS